MEMSISRISTVIPKLLFLYNLSMKPVHKRNLQRATEKRLAKHLEEIQQRRRASTTEWVDEHYSERLAGQFYKAIKASKFCKNLRSMREDVSYLTEYREPDGTYKVWIFDVTEDGIGIGMYPVSYDHGGRYIRKSFGLTESVVLTIHAAQRLYQRLRTNSPDDVKEAVRALTGLSQVSEEDAGKTQTLRVPGFGRFELAVAPWQPAVEAMPNLSDDELVIVRGKGLCRWGDVKDNSRIISTWIVKTFIDE